MMAFMLLHFEATHLSGAHPPLAGRDPNDHGQGSFEVTSTLVPVQGARIKLDTKDRDRNAPQ